MLIIKKKIQIRVRKIAAKKVLLKRTDLKNFTRIDTFIKNLKVKDGIEAFIERLEELNLHLCPFMDMEEDYCEHYKNEIEDLTGGYCTCHENCNTCKEKVWNDDLGVPVDKTFYCKIHEIMKEKHPIRLDIFCPKCKPHLIL